MNYTFFESLYGIEQTDYIGVGIAMPISMQLLSKRIISIGGLLRSTIEHLNKKGSRLSTLWARAFTGASLLQANEAEIDVWSRAMEERNRLVCLQVNIHGRSLFVGTYHMPCLYDKPDVMNLHALAVKDLMFRLSGGHPFILAGDFNTQPHEIAYRAITEPGVAQRLALPSIPNSNILYPFDTRRLLHSAYRSRNGAEPAFTNYATTLKAANFIGTLDYIFYAGHLAVTDVLKLDDHPTGRSFPDKKHPSDHMMLAASFLVL